MQSRRFILTAPPLYPSDLARSHQLKLLLLTQRILWQAKAAPSPYTSSIPQPELWCLPAHSSPDNEPAYLVFDNK